MSVTKAVMRHFAIVALAFALLAGAAGAAPGDLDPSFGQDGRVGIVSGRGESANAVAVQPDGKILVAGGDAVYRLKRNGSLDPTFNDNGRLGIDSGGGASANALALQPDGKILVAGHELLANFNSNIFIHRLNPNGSFDSTFGQGGVRRIMSNAREFANALALQPDGKILVAGNSFANTFDVVVYRLGADGSDDSTFNGSGRATIDSGGGEGANAVAPMPDGRIVVAGVTAGPGVSDAAIYRLSPTGGLDLTFNGSGTLAIDSGGGDDADALALQPDGRIVVAGSSTANTAAVVYRVNPDGALDPGFGGDGVVRLDEGRDAFAYALTLQPNGKIVVAGSATVSDNADAIVHRLNANGSLDAGFGHAGRVGIEDGGNAYAYAVALQTDGKIVAAGETSLGQDAVVYRLQGGEPKSAGPAPTSTSRTRPPVLGRLRITPSAFRSATNGPSALSAARRGGALVSFTLDRAAGVRITVERATKGRRVGARCVKLTRSNRGRRPCTRYTALAGGFARKGIAGANRFRFTGRLNAKRLRSARYRLVATPSADGLRGDARHVRFRVKP